MSGLFFVVVLALVALYIQAFSTGSFQVSGQVIGDPQNDCRRMILDTRLGIKQLGNEQNRMEPRPCCSDRSQSCPSIARFCSRYSNMRRICPKTCNTC
eukprot:maker-scaffold131_size323982-snap-gene-2.19 protein:Tk05549 transcript:maker-scaffold131_size323982-snap-gene-2.19-mRNA-1 annotation:"hypothetical protein"